MTFSSATGSCLQLTSSGFHKFCCWRCHLAFVDISSIALTNIISFLMSYNSESCLKMYPVCQYLCCWTVSKILMLSCIFKIFFAFLLHTLSIPLIFSFSSKPTFQKLLIFLCQPMSLSACDCYKEPRSIQFKFNSFPSCDK